MFVNKEKLQIAMATACMNAFELCRAADIRYQTYVRITNRKSTKPATIGKIARALNIPVTEIIETNAAATVDNAK